MNIEYLRRFIAVAEHLSFTSAAEQLFIGQSTLSRQVAALENDLGVILLIRGPRSVQLTEAGEILYIEGRKLLRSVDLIRKKTIAASNGAFDALKILTVPANFKRFDELCACLKSIYPGFQLYLEHVGYETIVPAIESDMADLGVSFSFFLPNTDKHISYIPLMKDHFSVLCHPNHPISGRESIYLSELDDDEILFGAAATVLLRQQRKHGYTIGATERAVNHTMESTFLSIKANCGVCILPTTIINTFNLDLVQVPLADEDLQDFDIVLLYNKDKHSASLKRFLDITEKFLNEISTNI